jgi:hypothetical protein
MAVTPSISQDGKQVFVGDQVSITALVVSTAPFGSTIPSGLASVTVETAWSPTQFVIQANDANAVEHSNDAAHPALSFNGGKNYGAPQDQCTVLGTCTAISGTGDQALLTVTLVTSGLVVTVPAGAVRNAAAYGGSQ